MPNNILKTLIIDDDAELCELLVEYLTPEGIHADFSNDWEEGLKKVATGRYSLVILDLMLPKTSGFQVLDSIHKISAVPVIMLTARNDATNRIVGLEKGADDYMFKPVNPRELIARIRSIMRRVGRVSSKASKSSAPPVLRAEDVELDPAARRVTCSGAEVMLTSVEFALLEVLLQSAGSVISKEFLAKNVMGRSFFPFDRSIDVHISHIRKKLGKNKEGNDRIKTIRSEGYQYVVKSSELVSGL